MTQALARRPARTGIQRIPVLLYHAVTDDPPADQPRFTVTPAQFAEHVDAMVQCGGVALTIGEFAAALRCERELPARAWAITFDDGFLDTPRAVGELAAHGIASTVFATTGRLAGPVPQLAPSALEELNAMESVELGAHTVTHPRLEEIDIRAARAEITASKHQLEQRIGRSVSSFAYPHGAYDLRVRSAVKEAGFTAAAAVKNAISHAGDDPYAIARWTVQAKTTRADIERILTGEGAPLAWSGERNRTRAYRRARQLHRRLGRPSAPTFEP